MARIGVLVFPPDKITVGRADRSDYSHDGLGFNGLSKVLSELHEPFDYIAPQDVTKYEYVLCSLISYHDVLNVIRFVPKTDSPRLLVGGPACANIRPLLGRIRAANFGRCDCGKICDVVNGVNFDSVWRSEHDPGFVGMYSVDTSSAAGLGDSEKAFGCRQKCAFCFYSYWNGNVEIGATYSSGFSIYEDFFQELSWEKCKRGGVTALDGCTEETRLKVRKRIKRSDIITTLLRSNDVEYDKKLRLKVYMIAGYEWEQPDELERLDLVDCVKECERDLRNRIVIKVHVSHFIPFQKTPLWASKFNASNYRTWCVDRPLIYDNGRQQIYSSGSYTPSPSSAACSTILQRAQNTDDVAPLASKRFQSAGANEQLSFMKKKYAHLLQRQEAESIGNIKTRWNYA